MAGTRIACRGCGEPITISRVRAGEDDTVPWIVALPHGHARVADLPDRVHYYCHWTGDRYITFPPKREAEHSLPCQCGQVNVGVHKCEANDEPEIKYGDKRTLDWWESQYRSKLADLAAGPGRERPLPAPEELKYFEDKIIKLGGNPRYAKDLLWLDLQNQLVQEICPELDRPEPAPRRVRRAKFHAYHGVAAGFMFTAGLNFMIGSTAVGVVWAFSALVMLMTAERRSY